MWINILLIGIGSMAGGISRYLLSSGIRYWFPGIFPLGILLVNILGCFLIGLFAGLLSNASSFPKTTNYCSRSVSAAVSPHFPHFL